MYHVRCIRWYKVRGLTIQSNCVTFCLTQSRRHISCWEDNPRLKIIVQQKLHRSNQCQPCGNQNGTDDRTSTDYFCCCCCCLFVFRLAAFFSSSVEFENDCRMSFEFVYHTHGMPTLQWIEINGLAKVRWLSWSIKS